jgi:hypothetical protein
MSEKNLFELRLEKAVENIKELGFDEFFIEVDKKTFQCKFINHLRILVGQKETKISVPNFRHKIEVRDTEENWFDAISGNLKPHLNQKLKVAEDLYGFDSEKIPDTVFSDECDEFTVDDVVEYLSAKTVYSFDFEEGCNPYVYITNDEFSAGSTLAELLWEAFEGAAIKENETMTLAVKAECASLVDAELIVPQHTPVVFMDKDTEQCRVCLTNKPINIGKLMKVQSQPSGEKVLGTKTPKNWDLSLSNGVFDGLVYPFMQH